MNVCERSKILKMFNHILPRIGLIWQIPGVLSDNFYPNLVPVVRESILVLVFIQNSLGPRVSGVIPRS